ncbi:MAG: flagellar biosynthetic protein FliP [Acidimicrobiales bacterium]|nr:flagellar biosynthetic protein FliP [Acidimicrobiales bacterium]
MSERILHAHPGRILARLTGRAALAGIVAAFVWALCGSGSVSAAGDSARPSAHAVAPSAGTPTPPAPIDSIPPIDVPSIGGVPAQLPDGGSTVATSPSTGNANTGTGSGSNANINLSLPGTGSKDSSNSVVIILLLTVVSVAPSLLVLCTSFTRIVIVLSLTRNALGIPSIPPQQVIVGLSVFLTLFVMGPTLGQMKTEALDPLLAGKITTSEALVKAETPLRTFLLKHTREDELGLFLDASKTATPVAREKVPMNALIPAFVLSELKSSFIIGFVIFIPFLIIDLVVSAVLMGLGMMMLPPSFVSLPFKLLLFVMLDGWMLIVGMLLTSYK